MKRSWHITQQEIKKMIAGQASAPQNYCPKCRHAKFIHIETGLGSHCVLCLWLIDHKEVIVPNKPKEVCHEKFVFRLSLYDRQQAILKGDPLDFEQEEICGADGCGLYWSQHQGYLCPSGNTTFVKMFPKGKE